MFEGEERGKIASDLTALKQKAGLSDEEWVELLEHSSQVCISESY